MGLSVSLSFETGSGVCFIAVLVVLDSRAAGGFGAAYFPVERPLLVTAEAGASPGLFEFDPVMTDSAADAALPSDPCVDIGTNEVLCLMCWWYSPRCGWPNRHAKFHADR